jgi:hypothetical protein
MKMNYSIGNNKGVTMTELIVAAVLLAVGIFGSLKVFRGISQSIFMSQTKQVATTLAREKLEALQVLPYYRLRAQGAPTYYQPGGSGKPYIYYDRKQNSGHDQLRHRDAFVVADGIIHFHPRAWFLGSREKSPVVPLSIHHEIPGHRVFPLIAMRRNGQTRFFPLLKAFF